jgi:ubiquinone/menaquinone biosynthesis C-methylase UbiE
MQATDPIAQVAIHEKVKEIVRPLLLKGSLKVLDAAAGNGYLTEWLVEQKADVTPIDISGDDWRVPSVKCEYSDFNQGIAVADETFDLTISIETIEHLENPFNFIRELSRVTKPNGIVVITTPNVHSIRSRFKYLFCGIPTLFEYIINDHMGQHITPVSIGQFIYGFRMAKLKLTEVFSTGPKCSMLVTCFLFLLNSVTSIGTRLIKMKRKYDQDYFLNVLSTQQLVELNRDVSLILVAHKRN